MERRLILVKNDRNHSLVSQKSNISVDDEGDRTGSPNDKYAEPNTDSLSQQTLLADARNENGFSLINSMALNGLHDNDNKILGVLKGDANGDPVYSFNGLVRELNLHQQSLSRSIKRLMVLGLVEQIRDYGFRLTELGRHLGRIAPPMNVGSKNRKYTQLAYLDLHFT